MNAMSIKMDFWLKNRKNVLFVGAHGVGKTAMVKEVFDRNNLNWMYFSAATMDPWCDFIGVPKEKKDNELPESFLTIKELLLHSKKLAMNWIIANWKVSAEDAAEVINHVENKKESEAYLELVRPEAFASGKVEALFFDEYNRSPKKVRNAVMELIQFKSINGMEFPNLKVVWAAINPYDEEETYQVEEIDPAQLDRFQITVEVPNKPNNEYFSNKFGERNANTAIQWWGDLPPEIKKIVTPRRLDYALEIVRERGDVRDVLPRSANIKSLIENLNNGPISEKLDVFVSKEDTEGSRTFLANENNFAAALKFIRTSDTLMNFFVPLFPKEKIASTMVEDDRICDNIISRSDRIPAFNSVCKEIIKANSSSKLIKKIKNFLTANVEMALRFNGFKSEENCPVHYNKDNKNWNATIKSLKKESLNTAAKRSKVFEDIKNQIPQHQTADEALDTLTVLDKITSLLDNNTKQNDDYNQTLTGIANHCFSEYQRNTGDVFEKLIASHGHVLHDLMAYFEKQGLTSKLKRA